MNSEKYEYIYLNEDMNCNANMTSSTQIVKAPAVGKDSSVVLNIHWASESGLIHLVNVFGAAGKPQDCPLETKTFKV